MTATTAPNYTDYAKVLAAETGKCLDGARATSEELDDAEQMARDNGWNFSRPIQHADVRSFQVITPAATAGQIVAQGAGIARTKPRADTARPSIGAVQLEDFTKRPNAARNTPPTQGAPRLQQTMIAARVIAPADDTNEKR